MDVAFVVDDTGSMGGAIDNVKSGLSDILSQIDTASGGDFQLGLVTFKDTVQVDVDLVDTDGSQVGPAINALSASGGSGLPEASDEALNTTVNALAAADRDPGQQSGDFSDNWRPGAVKIAIIVTDALPGGFDDTFTFGVDDAHAHKVAVDAFDRDIKISAIYVPTFGEDPLEQAIMEDYANTTGGVFVQTAEDGTGTATGIQEIVASCGSSEPGEEPEEPEEPVIGPCTLTQGFWKNHGPNARGRQSNEWPVDNLTIGGVNYDDETLVDLFRTPPKGDASMVLAHQLIAAMLNRENGSLDQTIDVTVDGETFATVDDVIDDANAHLADLEAADPGGLPYGVDEESSLGMHLINISAVLEAFNEGTFTPGCNADVAVDKGGNATLAPGETVAFFINVTNLGPGAATNVTLADQLPDGNWTLGGDSADCGIDAENLLECDFGVVFDAGAFRNVTVTREAPAETCEADIVNTATVATDGVDNDLANNEDSWTIDVECVF